MTKLTNAQIETYLLWNPDVQLSGADPQNHYRRYGITENRVVDEPLLLPVGHSFVDVLMVVRDPIKARATIDSLIVQSPVRPLIHCVDPGFVFQEPPHPNVKLYRRAHGNTDLEWLHHIVPYLRADWLLFMLEGQVACSSQLEQSVQIANTLAVDAYSGAIQHPEGVDLPNRLVLKSPELKETLLLGATLLKRHLYIDSGGFGDWQTYPDLQWLEYCARLFVERRRIGVTGHQLVYSPRSVKYSTELTDNQHAVFKTFSSYRLFNDTEAVYEYGLGWAKRTPVQADVVIPFRNHIHYLDDAIKSLLEQSQCRLYIHLVDDSSDEVDGIEYLVKKWNTTPFVFTYYNTESIGPFRTINSLYPYLRTDYLAIQDADDISFKGRILDGINLLELSGADLLTTDVVPFSNSPSFMAEYQQHDPVHASMIIRKGAFRSIGGYSSVTGVRYGLDHDLFLRASHARLSHFRSKRKSIFKRLCQAALEREGQYLFDCNTLGILQDLNEVAMFNNPSMFGGIGREDDLLVPLNQQPYMRPVY